MSSMNNFTSQVVDIVGGQTELAIKLGVSPQAVQQWVKKGSIPSRRVLAVEAAANKRITRYQLRPDIYGLNDVDTTVSALTA